MENYAYVFLLNSLSNLYVFFHPFLKSMYKYALY